MEDGRTEEREHRERDNDEHKLMLEVVRQNLSWTIRNLTLPSESFCGRGRGTPLKFELQAGLPPKSNLVRDLTFKWGWAQNERRRKSLARANDVD